MIPHNSQEQADRAAISKEDSKCIVLKGEVRRTFPKNPGPPMQLMGENTQRCAISPTIE